MELSASVLKGLQVAGSSAVGDGAFSKLASRVLQATLGLGDASSVQGERQVAGCVDGVVLKSGGEVGGAAGAFLKPHPPP